MITHQLPVISDVIPKMYDVLGREVATLVDEVQKMGRYDVESDGARLASGIYFYRLRAGNFNEIRKLVLLK